MLASIGVLNTGLTDFTECSRESKYTLTKIGPACISNTPATILTRVTGTGCYEK